MSAHQVSGLRRLVEKPATAVSVALFAAVAAVVSYQHVHMLVLKDGETRRAGVLIPLSFDEMVVPASMSVAGEAG